MEQTARQAARDGLRHIPELDGLRGIAALVVFFHHVCFASVPLTPVTSGLWPESIRLLYRASAFGASGVDLFFVLSGFLITSILIETRESNRYYQDFYWKRALRVLPLYLLCLIFIGLIFHSWSFILLCLAFMANITNILQAHGLNIAGSGPFWSLSIEEQFYLVWPTVVRRKNVGTLFRWAVCLGLISVVIRFAAAMLGHYNYQLTPLVCDSLAFGAALACLHRQGSLPSKASLRAFTGSLVVGLAIAVATQYHQFVSVAITAALYKSGVTLIGGAVIGLCVSYSGSPLLAVFRSSTLRFFGMISYAFYMIHLYVLEAWDHWRGSPAPGDVRTYWIRVIAILAGTIAAALITRYVVELPAMRLRRFVLSPRGKTETAQHAA